MKKLLLVYPPFCTPTIPAYSITNLYWFVKENSDISVEVLDLNLEFHKVMFKDYYDFVKSDDFFKIKSYSEKTDEFMKKSMKLYSENHKKIVNGMKPDFFEEILGMIENKDYDYIGFSFVYSSQAFYGLELLKALKDKVTIIGGPAVNKNLIENSSKYLQNEMELVNFIDKTSRERKDFNFKYGLDFSIFNLDSYFVASSVIPLKTSSTCFHRKCSFCSHYNKLLYREHTLEQIEESVKQNKAKHYFLIDDMIHKKRLLDLGKIFKKYNCKWTCQLRPTIDLDFQTLRELYNSGLDMVLWGVESGNDRVLKLINKGTNTKDVEVVLADAHKIGIKNVVYFMIGFPTETKEEFFESVDYLKKNSANIDLISTSVFGLQKGTILFDNYKKYGVTKVWFEERTVLDPNVHYEVSSGLTQEEANKLNKGHRKTFDSINKYPKAMNYLRSHMLFF